MTNVPCDSALGKMKMQELSALGKPCGVHGNSIQQITTRLKAFRDGTSAKLIASKGVTKAPPRPDNGDTRTCEKCGAVKPTKSFSGARKKCTSCRNAEAKGRSLKRIRDDPTARKCDGCDRAKPVFHNDGTSTCVKCLEKGMRHDATRAKDPERLRQARENGACKRYRAKRALVDEHCTRVAAHDSVEYFEDMAIPRCLDCIVRRKRT